MNIVNNMGTKQYLDCSPLTLGYILEVQVHTLNVPQNKNTDSAEDTLIEWKGLWLGDNHLG